MNKAAYFWAKTTEEGLPGCSVKEHCLATAEVAQQLLKLFPDEFLHQLPEGLLTLVALHDIGKISPGFQTKCAQWKGPSNNSDEQTLYQWSKYNRFHAATSQWILSDFFSKRYGKERPWTLWAECAGAHHGAYNKTIPTFPARNHRSQFLPQEWLSYTNDFITEMQEIVGALPTQPLHKEKRTLQEWLIGLTEVADWIASNEDYFPPAGGLSHAELREHAKQALHRIGFHHTPCVVPGKSWSDLFPHAPVPRPIQQHLWEMRPEPGTYIVEDAMGGGKTEAALGLAYHLMEAGIANGLYFALPTQTTSNRIFERVLDFLQRTGAEVNERSLRLAHGNSWLIQGDIFEGWRQKSHTPTDSRQDARNWFASSRRALLTRFGVGTLDQALMGEIAVRHSFVRRFALAGKVVILDEVHSYDMYTGSLLDSLVHHLRELGASVIILSATLTRPRLQTLLRLPEGTGDFSAYPLISTQTRQREAMETSLPTSCEQHIRVCCRSQSEAETVQLACQRAEKGQCVLWIRNTVQEAQQAYRLLCAERREGGPEAGLLHARYPLWRRQELENTWISRLGRESSNRPQGCVLIATQVAEQSLDIDADFLITDLAPTDMLLQRVGRLWRHERPTSQRHADAAEMLILTPELHPSDTPNQQKQALGLSGAVYPPYVLLRTHEIWQHLTELSLPGDIRPLLNHTYDEREEIPGSAMAAFHADICRKKQSMRDLALVNMQKGDITAEDNDDVPTRYNTRPTLDILLLKKEPEPLSCTETRYEPLHGEPFVINNMHWNFATARAIQENIVRIPLSIAKGLKDTPGICGYGFSTIHPLFPLDSFNTTCYPHHISWTEELGVYQSQPSPTTCFYDEGE